MRKVFGLLTLLAVATSPAVAQINDGSIEVPLREHAGRFVVPVTAPDGTEIEFILSTGTPMVFSESVAALLVDGGGLTMAGLPVPTESSQTIPDDNLTIEGVAFGGLIGPAMLNEFDVLIDPARERMILKPFGRSVEWDGMTMSEPVRVRVMHGVFMALDVQLNGKEYKAMIDLRMPAILVNEGVQTDLGLEEKDWGTLTLGSTSLADLPVHVSDNPIFQGWSPNGDGFVVVGAPVAYDCAFSLSWVHREIRTCVK